MFNEIIKTLQCLAYLSMIAKNNYSLVNRIREKFIAKTETVETQIQVDKTGLREIIEEVEKQIVALDEEIKTIENNLLKNRPKANEEEIFLVTELREDRLSERIKEWLEANGWEFIDKDEFSEEKLLIINKELISKEKLRDEWDKLRYELNVRFNN